MTIKEKWKRFKPLPIDIKARLEKLKIFFQTEKVLLCYIFGSYARGREASDIDLAILLENDIYKIREKIEEVLGTQRLDIVDLKKASPLMKFNVLKNGILLYKKSVDIENNFELSVLREYRDTSYLREKQREILKRRMAI